MLTESKTFTGWTNSSGWTFTKGVDGFTIANRAQSGKTSNNIPSLFSPKIAAQKGETFTFSCDFMVDDVSAWDGLQAPYIFEVLNSSGTRVQFQDVQVTAGNTNKPAIASGQWRKFYSTHTITASDAAFIRMRVSLFRNGSIHVQKCKVERGTTLTPWIPAQGDSGGGKNG